jgi:hypothetical protein
MQKRTSGSSDRKTFAEVQDNDIARLPQFTFAKVVRTFMFFIIKITSTWPAIQRDQLVTVTAASSWYGNDIIAWLSRPGAFYSTSQPPRNMQNARPISTCYYMIFLLYLAHTLCFYSGWSRIPADSRSNAKVQLPQCCCLGGLRDVCTSVCLVISVLDVRNPASSIPSGV